MKRILYFICLVLFLSGCITPKLNQWIEVDESLTFLEEQDDGQYRHIISNNKEEKWQQ